MFLVIRVLNVLTGQLSVSGEHGALVGHPPPGWEVRRVGWGLSRGVQARWADALTPPGGLDMEFVVLVNLWLTYWLASCAL